ncbi:TPA: hypothetical protein NI617_004522 [Pseudomonas aeruginosa]|uniref:hypothetical protein n=1 Tax=Pseudomonas aeruginosa TaxID=287 RepID=UPI00053D246F|nr:hypothetical protein [Pseudomonas aeruginosa]MBI9183470.1 hypothetical protein [Pseudomonas aeruginosa]HCF7540577.1 hypothetical protein [Pseudomonas aeruginosa]HCF9365830.1 hypothetical protein [Pseudomonas aeruginosa]HCF9372152.1 hypothetical protein [Pseudomonas aeruginosa]HCF9376237.1 hypothetical protein [Pseudomonas aeruginosa]
MKTTFIGLACLLGLLSNAMAAENPLQTRIAWLSECPSDPKPVKDAATQRSALIGLAVAAVAPKLIEGAVDTAAEALKAAGQTKTFASTAKTGDYFYKVSKDADLAVAVDCLVIVRGVFDEKRRSPFQWADNSDALKGLQKANVQVEAKLQPLQGLKYFQLVPQYLYIEEFDQSSFFHRKERDYIVAVTFSVPGGAQPFGSAEMTFPNVTRKTPFKDDDWRLRSAVSLPIAFPPESADATKAKEKRESQLAPYLLALDILTPPKARLISKAPDLYREDAYTKPYEIGKKAKAFCDAVEGRNRQLDKEHRVYDERCNYPLSKPKQDLDEELEKVYRDPGRQAWARKVCTYVAGDTSKKTAPSCTNEPNNTELASKTFTYVTSHLTLSETREGSKFALYLGNALSSSKSDVSAALQSKLLPKSQAMKDSEEAAARSARSGAMVADLEVTKAEEALADALMQPTPVPVDITDARIALLRAKIAANDAHRKAGTAIPYKEVD